MTYKAIVDLNPTMSLPLLSLEFSLFRITVFEIPEIVAVVSEDDSPSLKLNFSLLVKSYPESSLRQG